MWNVNNLYIYKVMFRRQMCVIKPFIKLINYLLIGKKNDIWNKIGTFSWYLFKTKFYYIFFKFKNRLTLSPMILRHWLLYYLWMPTNNRIYWVEINLSFQYKICNLRIFCPLYILRLSILSYFIILPIFICYQQWE